jgi:hypothetical protein
MKRHTAEDAAEAQRRLKRMSEQSEKLLTGPRHDVDDDEANDPTVILGRRIGRALSFVIFAGLLIYLTLTYMVR